MDNKFRKYYTPSAVSESLINMVEFTNDAMVADICCGSCNLLNAAKKKNRSLKCYGVDINEIVEKNCIFEKCDGREFAIKHRSMFDYALANPPFGENKTKKYKRSFFKKPYNKILSSRIEVEMLLANLSVLKDSGTLLAIMPSTFSEGRSSINARKILATENTIVAIIKLPINAFFPEKIKCSAILMKKEKNSSDIETLVYQMNTNYQIEQTGHVSNELMKRGYWVGKVPTTSHPFIICQGRISSQNFDKRGALVLHVSRSGKNWAPSKRYTQDAHISNLYAEDGDILISRVGVSAGEKCVYHGNRALISDCLIIIKNPTQAVVQNIMDLDFTTKVTGLSTPHITIQSICDLYYETYESDMMQGDVYGG